MFLVISIIKYFVNTSNKFYFNAYIIEKII